ncbi:hypothetical protein ACQEV9_44750 [Streptomyces chartreusis]|uniref:hypothetical protein n=1 Tax=Streptomyces chartreusis TaxID=1969 RepID=UPI003D8F3634
MNQPITMPPESEVSPGPRRDLLAALHRLYQDAGYPGLRPLAEAIDKNEDKRADEPGALGRPSREAIAGLLRGSFTRAPVWENLQALVWTLAKRSHRRPDVHAEVSRFHALWLAADSAGKLPAQSESWVDDPDLYHQPLPRVLRKEKWTQAKVIELYHRGEYQALPAAVMGGFWPGGHLSDGMLRAYVEFVQEQYEEHRPLLARAVLNGGALSPDHRNFQGVLEHLGQDDDAEQVRLFSLQNLPAPAFWSSLSTMIDHGTTLFPDPESIQYLTDTARHRTASALSALLQALPEQLSYRAEKWEIRALATVHAAVATQSTDLVLAELLAQLHDEGALSTMHTLWGEIVRARTPIAPLIATLRQIDQAWQITPILRRLLYVPSSADHEYVAPRPEPYSLRSARDRGTQALLEELDTAGLSEEADTVRFLIQINGVTRVLQHGMVAPYGATNEPPRWGY